MTEKLNDKKQIILNKYLNKSPYSYEVSSMYRDYVVVKFILNSSLSFTERKAKIYKETLEKEKKLWKSNDK